MLALILPVFVIFTALVINVSHLVFARVRLQNTVDACAMAAATVQAVGLNEMADLNLEYTYEKIRMLQIVSGRTWYNNYHPGNAISYFESVFREIFELQINANNEFAGLVDGVAQKVMYENPAMQKSTLTRLNPGNVLAIRSPT